jgi:PAS domain S-box-containing protein
MSSPSPEEAAASLHSKQGRSAVFIGDECQQFLNALPDIVYVLDLEGRLVHWNKTLAEVTGYSPEELQGMSALDFFPPEEKELHVASIKRKLQGYDEVESHLMAKDGKLTWYHWSGGALKDANGEVVGVIGTGRDVSERKRLEEAVRAQTKRLMDLDRLKNAFVSAVSHELRTPLTSIKGYVEFLQDRIGGPLTDEQAEFVHHIALGARRLTRLVDDLLDFARLEAGTFKLTNAMANLGELVDEVIQSMRPQAMAAQVQLSLQLPPEPPTACVDAQRVEQVVMNLVHNAIKFTPPGGHIAVSLEDRGVDVRVAVKDSGVGIRPEHLPKLFAKFYQISGHDGADMRGVGLGLFISKSLVAAHGGTVGVESQPGQGATFWFTLPKLSC